MSAVLTAETHRDIRGDCTCTWDHPACDKPWVRMAADPRCRVHRHMPCDTAAAKRRYWQLRAEYATERRDVADQVLADAQRHLAELGVRAA